MASPFIYPPLLPLSLSLQTTRNIYIGNAAPYPSLPAPSPLLRRRQRAMQQPPSSSSSSWSQLPPIVIIHCAQAISVTMGRFPKRSGVDAKLSEGSLFDLLLPIYKHTSAAAGEREREVGWSASVAASRERERCRGVKRWPPFRRISCVGSLYVRLYSPTSIICIHTGDTSCERNVLATLPASSSPLTAFSPPLLRVYRVVRQLLPPPPSSFHR